MAGFIVLFSPASGQEAERNKVLLEITTGTWCPYCPAAANGADKLVEENYDVAVIEYHYSDDYETGSSIARKNYYSVDAYPTSVFDGVNTHTGGGGASSSNYNIYLDIYQSRKEIPSQFTIDVNGVMGNPDEFQIEVTAKSLASNSNDNIHLRGAITESHIAEEWQGLSELNFVNRKMLEGYEGIPVDFIQDSEQTFEYNFSIADNWNAENCRVVFFLQDDETKEVLQTVSYALLRIPGLFTKDLYLQEITHLPESDCMGNLRPVAHVYNNGSDSIKHFEIEYSLNNISGTKAWEGALLPQDTVMVEIPEISYTVHPSNTLELKVKNPDGEQEEYTNNNSITRTITHAPQSDTTLNLFLKTDSNPGETRWMVLNARGDTLYSGGPYNTANEWVESYTKLSLPSADCYRFILTDTGGDGLADGVGICQLKRPGGDKIAGLNNPDFGEKYATQFSASAASGINTHTNNSIGIYPNPAYEEVYIDLPDNREAANVKIYHASGTLVESIKPTQGQTQFKWDASKQPAGLYIVKLLSARRIIATEKVVVKPYGTRK